jgi:hypothetical protein
VTQIISDIEPASTLDSTMGHMAQVAVLSDVQPIRASCFSPSGEYFVLGTNSKTLKICALPSGINKGGDPMDHPYSVENWTEFEEGELGEVNSDEIEGARSDTGGQIPPRRKINVVFE